MKGKIKILFLGCTARTASARETPVRCLTLRRCLAHLGERWEMKNRPDRVLPSSEDTSVPLRSFIVFLICHHSSSLSVSLPDSDAVLRCDRRVGFWPPVSPDGSVLWGWNNPVNLKNRRVEFSVFCGSSRRELMETLICFRQWNCWALIFFRMQLTHRSTFFIPT